MNSIKEYSLFACPSFLDGLSRVLDIAGLYDDYNYSLSGEMADKRAIMADWNAIGNDILFACNSIGI